MLTLDEVLADVAASPGFEGCTEIGANSRSVSGRTPLHWMATLGDAVGTELLLQAGANIDAVDDEGNTALHEATTSRQQGVVGVLVAHGAQVHLVNAAGQSSLEMAEADGYHPTLTLLKTNAS
jgi:ankyrin repeat protein